MYGRRIAAALATGLIANAAPAWAQDKTDGQAGMARMSAEVSGPAGIAGTVALSEVASGQVLIDVDLSGVPAGEHGIHLHETGNCSADDFTSAGGHMAGDAAHGVLAEGGPHPGDLPNAFVGDDGVMRLHLFSPAEGLMEMVDDGDGSAFIVHSGADDYRSQPSGDAGARIACGVFSAT